MAECIDVVLGPELSRWPLADEDDVSRWSLAYAKDPRNDPLSATITHCEAEVRLTMPPAPEDPTKEPVIFVGHIDQLRDDKVWDVKSGRGKPIRGKQELAYDAYGHDLTLDYAWQIAAYALACTETFGRPILPGGVIRLRGYESKKTPSPVFYSTPWTLADCRTMIETAVYEIGIIRSGVILLRPGTHCNWCPAEHPHLCERMLQ